MTTSRENQVFTEHLDSMRKDAVKAFVAILAFMGVVAVASLIVAGWLLVNLLGS